MNYNLIITKEGLCFSEAICAIGAIRLVNDRLNQ